MSRSGAVFIIVCMMLISASAGAVLFLLAGLGSGASAVAALAVLTVLTAYHAVNARLRDRADFGTQIGDISRGTSDLALQLDEIRRRVASLESKLDMVAAEAAEKAYGATKPIAAELGDLGNLVKQLADTVSAHELRFAGADQFIVAAVHDAAPASPEKPAEASVPEHNPAPSTKSGADPIKDETAKAEAAGPRLIEIVREAIDANRMDLFLQPIVTLPQRKVRYYEAFTWLRAKDDTLLPPSEYIDVAETGGLMPQIDNLQLFRAVQVIRRLQLKNRDVGLFCRMSVSTLNDSQLFPQILQFMDANRALGSSFVLQFTHQALLGVGPLETEALAALRALGFQFCFDGVTDLRLNPRDLAQRGIRYVKVSAPLMLGHDAASQSDIHAADLSDLLGRSGISLIAERIETEAQVIELLEYDVRFGQGELFSPPRPVRADALRTVDAPARNGTDNVHSRAAAAVRASGAAR